jgi:hypothetical protein
MNKCAACQNCVKSNKDGKKAQTDCFKCVDGSLFVSGIKDVETITFSEMKEREKRGLYRVGYGDLTKPVELAVGYVTDENKSVKWNKEQVDNSRAALKKYYRERSDNGKAVLDLFMEDLKNAICSADTRIQRDQAQVIADRAYSESHSSGLHYVIETSMDLTQFTTDILDLVVRQLI